MVEDDPIEFYKNGGWKSLEPDADDSAESEAESHYTDSSESSENSDMDSDETDELVMSSPEDESSAAEWSELEKEAIEGKFIIVTNLAEKRSKKLKTN